MFRSSNRLNFTHFADDSTVFITGDEVASTSESLNSELNNVFTWLYCNKLSLNVNKSAFSIFTDKQYIIPTIIINDKEVSFARKTKFLGVVINNRLSFDFHVREVCSKLVKCCAVLRGLTDYVPPCILRKIYFSLAYPDIMYEIEVWGNSCKTQLSRLRSVQNGMV